AADPSIVDTGERRWLRWPRADALSRLPAAPSADELKGRIVVVGSFEPRHATPFGFVATPELVAQMLASHLGRHYIAESTLASAAVWATALFLCVPFLVASRSPRARTLGL